MDQQPRSEETAPAGAEHSPLNPKLLKKLGQSVISYGRGGKVNAYRYDGNIYYENGDYLGSDPDPQPAKK